MLTNFNSILVRLKVSILLCICTMYYDFNSILVRLKVPSLFFFQPKRNLFQFHSGAIKSGGMDMQKMLPFIFQFHSGAIKREVKHVKTEFQLNFNFILVRLKAEGRKIAILQIFISIPFWCD